MWVEAPADLRLARGLARDGAGLEPEWRRWLDTEAAEFAREGTRARADLRLDGAAGHGRTASSWTERPPGKDQVCRAPDLRTVRGGGPGIEGAVDGCHPPERDLPWTHIGSPSSTSP